ncbi:MAG TPA: glycosyltransferase family 4 protein, partial [Caulobacteraceae bacterium]|nr:glycosyltransferase family 4 protein [Caulobacteraceae bacterium]
DLARYPVKHPMPGRVTVGWIGSPATAHYLAPLEPVLSELAEETGLRAVAIGATVGSLFEVVPWSEDGEVEALADLDIGVMPLADSPWERGKCGYKLIQYMAMGLPVVASPVGVNTTIVRHGENGFLAANDDEWRTHLRALASDPQLRETMGRAGRRMVEETYSLQVQGPRLARLMRQAIESRRR